MNIVIPITNYCPVCEKETPMPSGYVTLKDGLAMCFTCKECYVAQIHPREGGDEKQEMTMEEYKNKVCMYDMGNMWLFQKPGLFDSKGNPIMKLSEFILKKLGK